MSSILMGKKIKIECLFTNKFILKSHRGFKKYIDGKPTQEYLGQVYEVVNINTFDILKIKVNGEVPSEILEAEKNGETVFLEFQNAVICQYFSINNNAVCDSIKADGVKVINNTTIDLF